MYLPYSYMSLYIYPICIHVSVLSLHVIVYLPYLYTCIFPILTCHCISTLFVYMYLPYSYMSLYIYPICIHVSVPEEPRFISGLKDDIAVGLGVVLFNRSKFQRRSSVINVRSSNPIVWSSRLGPGSPAEHSRDRLLRNTNVFI